MEQLLVIKTRIYSFIGKYEIYVMAAIRFVIALAAFRLINSATGYSEILTSYPVALIFALICCFLPTGLMMFFAAVLILIQFYAVSAMLCLVVGLMLVILFCVFLRFTDRKGLYTMLTPVLAHFGIPYVMPVASGIFDAPYTVISVVCGEAVYFIVKHAAAEAAAFASAESSDLAGVLSAAVTDMIADKEMYLYLTGFAVTAIVVFCIRRLRIKYAYLIAVTAGIVLEMIFIAVGEIRLLGITSGIFRIVIGCIVSLFIMLAACYMTKGMDYKKAEQLQFEDDDYYYYVKAVPKAFYAPGKKQQVKRTSSRPVRAYEGDSSDDVEEGEPARAVLEELRAGSGADAVERK